MRSYSGAYQEKVGKVVSHREKRRAQTRVSNVCLSTGKQCFVDRNIVDIANPRCFVPSDLNINRQLYFYVSEPTIDDYLDTKVSTRNMKSRI